DVTETFRQALALIGSEVHLAPACPEVAPATYLIKVSASASCSRGSLGPSCKPVFDLRGQECASGRLVFRSGLENLKASAADPGGEEPALRRMVQKIDPQAVHQEIRAALQAELPGEELK
ncbi:MAG TPA: hypothetical protein VF518_05900, partial [Polyangia bacterium]